MNLINHNPTAWYESARCTLCFSGVSGGVHLKATLANLRKLLDAGPKTDLSGLRGIATDRRKQLDPFFFNYDLSNSG